MAVTQFFPTTEALPSAVKQQILDFLRIHYPEGFMGANQFRDWISTPENHPAHIVIVEGERLISHTEIVWKYVEHHGITYKVYGLSGIMTYPEFRRQGYGGQVVQAGTEYIITRTDAELALFNCDRSLKNFYARLGWIPMERSVTLIGDREHPVCSDELLMMLFLSEKAAGQRQDFETIPIYYAEDTW